jgi:uncharacterized RDD family membrane protein YckC
LGLGAVAVFGLPDQLHPIAFLVWSLLALTYFPVLEHRFGRTLGKLVCRVRVVDSAGCNPTWGQVIVRTLLRLVEVNPALLGGVPAGIAVLASKKRQRLGDMAAGTFVVRAEDFALLSHSRSSTHAADRFDVGTDAGIPPVIRAAAPPPPTGTNPSAQWLLPTNRSGWAIAAGYLGLFSVLGFPAPFAVLAGVLALREIRRNPGLGGRGRALFGMVLGALFTLLLLAVVVLSLVGPR